MYELLARIHSPADLKNLTRDQLKQVAVELRQAIIDNLSKTGGHFASDLGAADLILALHTVYSVPKDKIIWDTGHQCYAHKMLTGRLDRFSTLRQYGGLSGFLRREESDYDLFGAGHAGTSISAANAKQCAAAPRRIGASAAVPTSTRSPSNALPRPARVPYRAWPGCRMTPSSMTVS